jgi:hypothetical protein
VRVALLPLSDSPAFGQACVMTHSPSPSQRAGRLRRIARRLRDVMAECAYAQRRMTELTTAPERYVLHPEIVPDTYADFLFRTSGVLPHEPPARVRASH